MKLLLFSDLHLELGTSMTIPPDLEFDVVLLPGDIHAPGHKAVHWAKRDSTFAGKPVVFVPGNHEYYRAPSFANELEAMRDAAAGSNVHVLDCDGAVIEGVRFLGCTLWTDFQLPFLSEDAAITNVEVALDRADRGMNDFNLIRVDEVIPGRTGHRDFKRLLHARDTLAMHWVARDWLRRMLEQPFIGRTVVVTHHAPSRESVASKFSGDPLTPAFASHLPDELFNVPSVWVHGHTHAAANYHRSGCNVIANPRGYRRRDGTFENLAFDSRLIVEIPSTPSMETPLSTSTK